MPAPQSHSIGLTDLHSGMLAHDAWSYWVDAVQRTALFLDTLRKRGDQYQEHAAKSAPHVLKFGCEVIIDGRELPRPVNYVLVRVAPPKGVTVDSRKRPFVV